MNYFFIFNLFINKNIYKNSYYYYYYKYKYYIYNSKNYKIKTCKKNIKYQIVKIENKLLLKKINEI